MFENPRRDMQARNFTTNVPKIVDLKSSSEQIFSVNCRWVPLTISFELLKHKLIVIDRIESFSQVQDDYFRFNIFVQVLTDGIKNR